MGVVSYVDGKGGLLADLDYHLPRAAVQIVRIDGKYQQTLECSAGITAVQWEADQKTVLIQFSDRTFRLTLATGSVTE